MKRGNSSFGVGHVALQGSRLREVDYSTMIYPLNIFLVCPKPRLASSFLNLLKPFSLHLWVSVGLGLALVTVVHLVMAEATASLLGQENSVSKNVFTAMACLLAEGKKRLEVVKTSHEYRNQYEA